MLREIVLLGAIGLVAGSVNGITGAGGGPLLIAALVIFGRYSQQHAQAVNLLMFACPVTAFAATTYWRRGHLGRRDLLVTGCLAVAFVIGSWVSSRYAVSLPSRTLTRAYGVMLIGLGGYLFWATKPPQVPTPPLPSEVSHTQPGDATLGR